MKTKIHAVAGIVGFLTILTFWISTVYAELFGVAATISWVKAGILQGMFILIPAMIIVGASGMSLGKKSFHPLATKKKKRMPIIGANGMLILLPAAIFLETKAAAGIFDRCFYVVQGIELIAGTINLSLMGLNIRDGLRITRRI